MFENENGRRREIKKNSCDCDRYVSGCDKCLNYLSAKPTINYKYINLMALKCIMRLLHWFLANK